MSAWTFTRDALYKMVWSKPMTEVASELGISDRGLAKICYRLQVRCPYRGYWAMLAAGKQPAKHRLRSPKGVVPLKVTIGPPAPREPSYPIIRAAAPKAKPMKMPQIRVSQRLTHPHPIVAAWIAERRRWQEAYTDELRRGDRLHDAIFKTMEKRGHSVTHERGTLRSAWIVIRGERIDLSLRERYRQRREPLSAQELKDPANIATSRRHRVVREPTGRLVLSANCASLWANKREWSDDDEKSIEDALPQIIVDLEAIAEAAHAARLKRLEEERILAVEAARQAEEQRRRKIDENRWARVRELARLWEEADRLSRFLEAAETLAASRGDIQPEVADWLSWAKLRVSRMDPLAGAATELVADTLRIDERT